MDLQTLKMFLAVAHERSFSRAAAKVDRTQPAVSQAVRRLETELGEELFDRSSKTGTLTEAGRMLENYGQRLVRLAEETESAGGGLRDLRRGGGRFGANEAAGGPPPPPASPVPPRAPGTPAHPRARAWRCCRGAARSPRSRAAASSPCRWPACHGSGR